MTKRSLQNLATYGYVLATSTCVVLRMKCILWMNLSKNRWLHQRNWGCIDSVNENRIFQACLNILPNSTEFSAKILQDFYPCNEIKFGQLAKVSITSATHYNTRACTHTLNFSKILVSKCLSVEYQHVRLLFEYNQVTKMCQVKI